MLFIGYVNKTNYKDPTIISRFVLTFFEGEPLCAEN
jgi:hypothetical protein